MPPSRNDQTRGAMSIENSKIEEIWIILKILNFFFIADFELPEILVDWNIPVYWSKF